VRAVGFAAIPHPSGSGTMRTSSQTPQVQVEGMRPQVCRLGWILFGLGCCRVGWLFSFVLFRFALSSSRRQCRFCLQTLSSRTGARRAPLHHRGNFLRGVGRAAPGTPPMRRAMLGTSYVLASWVGCADAGSASVFCFECMYFLSPCLTDFPLCLFMFVGAHGVRPCGEKIGCKPERTEG
jgi:hypothetical protein